MIQLPLQSHFKVLNRRKLTLTPYTSKKNKVKKKRIGYVTWKRFSTIKTFAYFFVQDKNKKMNKTKPKKKDET